MISVIKTFTPLSLVCSSVTKRPIFVFISSEIFVQTMLIQVFGFGDDFSFGILQSHAHWLWFIDEVREN